MKWRLEQSLWDVNRIHIRVAGICRVRNGSMKLLENQQFEGDTMKLKAIGLMLFLAVVCSLTSCRDPLSSERPVPVIFDTDMATDCDDSGALAMLHTLVDRGEADLLATVVNNRGEHSTGAAAAINAWYNRSHIPIGAYHGDTVGVDAADFFVEIAEDTERYGHRASTRSYFPSATEVYRRTLADAESPVTLISVGHLNNLYYLLKSGPDRYSPLTGRELVNEKVRRLVVMGGHFHPQASEQYPHGQEHNFHARGSATYTGPVIEHWPTPILFSGYEIGEQILTGSRLLELQPDHPVRRAYAGHPSKPLISGRESWDQTAVLAAIRDPQLYWDLSRPGRVTVDGDGVSRWSEDPDGNHTYLIQREDPSPEEIAAVIESLMVDSPPPE